MKLLLPLLVCALVSNAATRSIWLKWNPSASDSLVGISYNVLRCQVIAPSVGCVPTVPINSSPITFTEYTDSTAVVGDRYQYGVEAVAPPCALGVSPCGLSNVTTLPAPLYIPPRPLEPSSTASVTITVTAKGIAVVID